MTAAGGGGVGVDDGCRDSAVYDGGAVVAVDDGEVIGEEAVVYCTLVCVVQAGGLLECQEVKS